MIDRTKNQPSSGTQVQGKFSFHDRRGEAGPFDILGDVHGCQGELIALMETLGYRRSGPGLRWSHPHGRKLVFAGDLCDRGPDSPGVFMLVMRLFRDEIAYSVLGNHDSKLLRYLLGNQVQLTAGLRKTLDQFERYEEDERKTLLFLVKNFLGQLPYHIIFDGGQLVVAHAGLREDLHGVSSREAAHFAMYGETAEDVDAKVALIQRPWAQSYSGIATVVHGHEVTMDVTPINNVWPVDTGCVFGKRLSALRYPEMEVVSVPATAVHWTMHSHSLVSTQ
jgi:protein phosphatase